MADNIMNIGLSGLAAAQWGLTVTGQNISNANSPGYMDESPVFAESSSQYTPSGFEGQGVTTATVTRAYSSYLNTQMNAATATNSNKTASTPKRTYSMRSLPCLAPAP